MSEYESESVTERERARERGGQCKGFQGEEGGVRECNTTGGRDQNEKRDRKQRDRV